MEDIAEVLFIQILEEILADVDEVLDVLHLDGVFVEEQVKTVVPPLLLPQQLHYLSEDQMLLLLVIVYLDVCDFLHQAG